MSRGQYPNTRMRRNRMQAFSRRLVAENRLSTDDLIWPLFVIEGDQQTEAIDAMPGVSRHSIDRLLEQAKQAVDLGIPAIAIFPSIDASLKDPSGSLAQDGDNLVCRAVRAVKFACPELGIVCDVALDPFTDHGHDGVMRADEILNDETVEILCQQAINQANAAAELHGGRTDQQLVGGFFARKAIQDPMPAQVEPCSALFVVQVTVVQQAAISAIVGHPLERRAITGSPKHLLLVVGRIELH